MENDIICLSETWLTSPAKARNAWKNFDTFWVNAIKDKTKGHASGGIVMFVKKTLNAQVLDSSESWLIIHVSRGDYECVIGAVYFHPECNMRATLQGFRDSVEGIQRQFGESPIILAGDYNARVGMPVELPEELVYGTPISARGETTDVKMNPRGALLKECMNDMNFVLMNGRSIDDCPA